MRTKKVPLRKCVGCSEMTGRKPGRGAYVCASLPCLQAARKAKRLERAFSCAIPAEVYDRMEEELQNSGG